jgi:rhamnose transport system permease protein
MTVAHTLPPVEGRRSFLGRVVRARELGLVVLIVALVALTSVSQPAFLFSDGGWRELLRQPTILILIALGEAIVIITRNIDLSVGSILCLSTYTAGTLFANVPGIPIILVILIAVALGAVLGLVNGLLVAFLRVPSLVITLGTLYAYRGIAILWIGPHFIRSSWLPDAYRQFGTLQFFGIPVLVVVLLIGWFMTSRRTGRDLYALGSNPEAATLFGLGERRLILGGFVGSGALAGLGGLVYLAIFATGDAQVGTGYELQAVAAAVVGGVAIVGGSGTIWGVALGAFFLATISNALPVLGVPSLWQQAIVGVLIVGAILLDRILFLTRTRRAKRRGSAA